MPERRGSMYDPARDAFVEQAQPSNDPASSPSNKRKRSMSVQDGAEEQPATQALTEVVPPATEAEPESKKLKTDATESAKSEEPAKPVTSISQLPRVKKAPAAARSRDIVSRRPERASNDRRRSRSPAHQDERGARRTPPRRRSPSPIRRSPSPAGRSPPRQRKRPGARAGVSTVDKDAVLRRQQDREKQQNDRAKADAAARGVHDVVKQHYNAVPQRGKEWRKTESHIRGLRSFNNWIKSAVIQKFSPSASYAPGARERGGREEEKGLLVLDMGCGKGGDLQKWHAAPQKVDLYVGLDPADVSIDQARERYSEMRRKPSRGGYRQREQQIFHADFNVKDCFGEWIGDIPIVQEVGIDGSVGPNATGMSARFGGGGFDVVTMMFSMHYAFESEDKARGMLRNVAGALKKGGRFIGVVPNSDIITAEVHKYNAENAKSAAANGSTTAATADDDDEWDPEKTLDAAAPAAPEPSADASAPSQPLEWGNNIYRVKFPGKVPHDGIFRPPFGWKYFFFLEEAVEEVPEYVVPWEAFRALAADYDLELQYRKPFSEIYDQEKFDPILGPLCERMGVRERSDVRGAEGRFIPTSEEQDAAAFYHAFCFYKV